MSFLTDALSDHAANLQAFAAEPVTYKRGPETLANLQAVAGQSILEETSGDALVSQIKAIDFLIRPAELILNAVAVEPQRGDQIIRADGSTFDILPGPAGVSWEWSDSHKTHFRIHTVYRKVAA